MNFLSVFNLTCDILMELKYSLEAFLKNGQLKRY